MDAPEPKVMQVPAVPAMVTPRSCFDGWSGNPLEF
jgi:hypothetical protein